MVTTKKKPATKLTSASSSKKRVKDAPIDGLGPVELRKLRTALRLVWQRSKQWKIVKDRCKDAEGYSVCEKCNKRTPSIKVDHRVPIGDMLEPGFIERLMVPSSELDGLCDECHAPKTKEDNKKTKEAKKKREASFPKGIEEEIIKEDIAVVLDEDLKNRDDLFTHEKIKIQNERNALEQFI